MDLVDYKEEVFESIKEHFDEIALKLDVQDVRFIPISALKGDNVVDRSKNMDWYQGPTLLYLLETVHITSDLNFVDGRFPVQYVIRPQSDEYHDYRGYAGRIASGIFTKGDIVKVFPAGLTSTITSINTMKGELETAFAPMSITLQLADDLDISRGDMITLTNKEPQVGQDIDLMLCWLSEKPMVLNGKYILRHTTNDVKCVIKECVYKVNINSLEKNIDDRSMGLNEIGRIKLRSTKPLFYDSYRINRQTGSVIIIDEGTNNTVGAGMII
jgi:sulfate adenylyltransferase subunit 1